MQLFLNEIILCKVQKQYEHKRMVYLLTAYKIKVSK